MDINGIWLTIISVSIAPVLGLLSGLAASYFSHRGLLEQARINSAIEVRKDRDEVTKSYIGLIAALNLEIARLRKQVETAQSTIEQLRRQVAELLAEPARLRAEYDALEDRYAMALARLGTRGTGS